MSPSRVKSLRTAVGAWFDDIQSEYVGKESFEFIHAMATPAPFKVMAELLGLRFEDLPIIQNWVRALTALAAPDVTPEGMAYSENAFREFKAYLQPVVEDRLQSDVRKDDILQEIIEAFSDGIIDFEQITMFVFIFIIAGHETTGGAIGNTMYSLFQHPDQWKLLVENPDLVPKAVDEAFRYESTSRHLHFKSMREDVEILGTTVPKGHRVIPWFGAAHRDPDRYSEPDRLNITRSDGGSMVFGFGRHFCIGSALARAELEEFFALFVERFPTIEQAGKAEWDHDLMLRKLERLPVRLGK